MFVFSKLSRSAGAPFIPMPRLDGFGSTFDDFGLRIVGEDICVGGGCAPDVGEGGPLDPSCVIGGMGVLAGRWPGSKSC